ncbi:ADP-ribosylglycohydrolase family protein [Chitinophaga sp. CF118]|uniref:ADP-ribosylglycohydrolase family protein n=1 Tax=Chitinophaga sp. CF118 TaxID=1884367 RepID=UPI000B7D5269|nr:ADP-ribosylglycohydrolase family protein [Chitinophaga sp. CF118]
MAYGSRIRYLLNTSISDTDTTAAVTGGIAGLLYGWETIPAEWLNLLAKKTTIDKLIINLQTKIYR